MQHLPCEHLPRHSHAHAFATLVLSGGYLEAGDTGRYQMTSGDVLLHRAWESHLDRFDRQGAEVLVLPIAGLKASFVAGRIRDVDSIVRLADQDPANAARELVRAAVAKPMMIEDWPDLLAQAFRSNPYLSISTWAQQAGLHIGSISRRFHQVFGMTPIDYRLIQRTLRALEALESTQASCCWISQDCGFADQAHMSRAVSRIARATPAAFRQAARRP